MAGTDEQFKLRARHEYKVKMAKESIVTVGEAQDSGINYPYGKSEKWKDVVVGPYDGQVYDVAISKQLTGQLIHLALEEIEDVFFGNLYIMDYTYANTARLNVRSTDDLGFIEESGSYGSGNDQFNRPKGITGDGVFLYICDNRNNRIKKIRKDNYSFVSTVVSAGYNITCDETYLYVCEMLGNKIIKLLKSNLSYVSEAGSYGSGSSNLHTPEGVTCDDTYLYICDTFNHRVLKWLKSDLSYVDQTTGSIGNPLNYPAALDSDDTYLYIGNSGYAYRELIKLQKDDWSFVSKVEINYAFDGTSIADITHDETYLYLGVSVNSEIQHTRLEKRLKSDLSLVSYLHSDDWQNDHNFDWIRGITIG